MLGRTLAGRGVASVVLQTYGIHNSTSQCSMLLTWMIHRSTGASALPMLQQATHLHTSSSSHLMKNGDVSSYLLNTHNNFIGNQRQPNGAWAYSCHVQTSGTPVLPFIATRGLAALSAVHSKKNVQNRNLPEWSPGGVTLVGGVVMGVRGMAKAGGFKNLQGRISSLQVKKRVQRKKKRIEEELEEEWQVTAYATADEYDLEKLRDGLTQQGLYSIADFTRAPSPGSVASHSNAPPLDPHTLPDPNEVLHVMGTYHLETEPREIFFFHSGAVVFWNVAELERNNVLRFLRKYQKGGHDERTVKEESESITYVYNDTPEIIRGQIVALKEAGLSGAEIARSLEVSRTTVSLWLKRIKEGNLSNRRCVMGAPGKITAAEEKLILEAARQQSVLNAVEIRHQLQLYHVSDKTVRRYLHKAGMRYPDPPVRETIRDNHKKARVRFATQHEDAGPDFWGRVIFSGEKSFSLSSSGKLKCWRWNEPRSRTKLVRDMIFLNPEGPTDLEKYTFSNALSLSVQLGIWEAALDEYIDNIEYVSEELSKTGLVVLSQDQVLQRMGQLFALRHLVNLSSDLLDVPDFYWEHENLEQLYRKTSEYLSVSKRTSVMNVKLSHCVELMELLKSHLNERHSARLEWIIIILIMVEVGFELLHFIERLF
ncbi:uncharacterized protein LOC135089580 isoform X3 [Scylla paramamosain]|uniref:uncharacterized protein LOC135089580 isoform X3 n=1 Tax=Scylla paramamosain TaxID=85552 RepID=UPI00308314E2